jgi:small-conductance mechanosensitive channel
MDDVINALPLAVFAILLAAYVLVGYVFVRPKSKLQIPALVLAITVIIAYPVIIFGAPGLSERERAILGIGILFLLLWLFIGSYVFLAIIDGIKYVRNKIGNICAVPFLDAPEHAN